MDQQHGIYDKLYWRWAHMAVPIWVRDDLGDWSVEWRIPEAAR